MLIPDILRKTTSHVPDKTAVLVDGVGSMTYGEWEGASNRLARALVDRGLEPGQRVVTAGLAQPREGQEVRIRQRGDNTPAQDEGAAQ